MNQGKVIVIEGACDGIGKSTQYRLLKERLENEGYKVANHHFPSYNTDQGKLVEMYLEGKFGKTEDLSQYFINSLYAIDRAISWKTELCPKFEEGNVVLLDRYTTSSLIYQSALIEDETEKNKFIDYVTDFEYNKLGIRMPDKVIFLTAPLNAINKMREARKINEGIQNDIHEKNKEFMEKVYNNAMYVSEYLKWDKIICNDGDKMKSIQEIHEEIYNRLK